LLLFTGLVSSLSVVDGVNDLLAAATTIVDDFLVGEGGGGSLLDDLR